MAEFVSLWLQENISELSINYKENFNKTQINPKCIVVELNDAIQKVVSIEKTSDLLRLKIKYGIHKETYGKEKKFSQWVAYVYSALVTSAL